MVVAARWIGMERGHAEALPPMVKDVMAEAQLPMEDLDRIAVTTGPGTFTGVRIGLAMARGLGLVSAKPVVGIDTLQAVACNARETGLATAISCDARLDEIYFSVIDPGGTQLIGPSILKLDEAAEQVPAGRTLILGTAAEALIAASKRHDLERGRQGDLPRADQFASLASRLPIPESMPSPLYLRGAGARPGPNEPHPLRPRIRYAAAAEARLIAALHAECFVEPWKAEEFASLMAMPGAMTIIAEDQGPVGFALLRQAADEAEIITIGTVPAARRRGVARAILDSQERALAGNGVSSLFLEVAKSNAAARAMYEVLGFSAAGNRKAYYRRGDGRNEDAITMKKVIGR
jgi:tRNA threonylcarbamoyl adenosine modification protein YeaZ/ribosomal-protein-alanine acetyltransferase